MNDTNTANAYLKTKVMTASREELRLMLLDGAIRFANQALNGMNTNDHEMAFNGFSQCRDIILELLNSIQPQHAPEIAQSVKELYTYMYGEMVKASINKDKTILQEVISLLEYERETWVMTMEQVAQEREQAPVAAPAAMNNADNAYARTAGHQSISFQA